MRYITTLVILLCAVSALGQSKISDNQIRTPPPLACADSSGSGTAQSCTTAPSYTPAAGNCVVYTTTTTNTGALTLNVNSQGAKAVQKWLGTALVSGDVVLNKPQTICYDGTNWQLSTIGNAPSSGSGTVTSVTCNAGLTGGAITTSGTCALATSATGSTGMILLEEHTASTSASLAFTTCISSTYDDYLLTFVNILPASNAVTFYVRYSTDGGSTYDSTSGHYASAVDYTGLTTSASNFTSVTSDTGIAIGTASSIGTTATLGGVTGEMSLHNPGSAATYKLSDSRGTQGHSDNTNIYLIIGAGVYKSATAVNAFQVLFSSGNIASGTVRCYGYTK